MINNSFTSANVFRQSIMISNRPIKLLLVEDDLGDSDLIEEAFEDSTYPVKISLVRDGIQAIAYLRREDDYAKASLPDLILLDLNLPRMGGQEVLKTLKSDDNFKHIPVIVLTTSDSQEEILTAYNLGANCYVCKPLGLQEFMELIRTMENYWFTVVKLPISDYQ